MRAGAAAGRSPSPARRVTFADEVGPREASKGKAGGRRPPSPRPPWAKGPKGGGGQGRGKGRAKGKPKGKHNQKGKNQR